MSLHLGVFIQGRRRLCVWIFSGNGKGQALNPKRLLQTEGDRRGRVMPSALEAPLDLSGI